MPWDNSQGQFVVSLCTDRQGNLWAGTEDQGVFRFNPRAPEGRQWTQFNTKNGLADDNAYALACDAKGRVWVGTLNHGVSVFNGREWRSYNPLTGPLGAHVTALAVCPTDGAVWGATEAGLFRYAHDAWTYSTRADGLPSDQASALAFDKSGTLYVATQCDGLAISAAASGWRKWRRVTGPDAAPGTPSGRNLPSNLTNALLVARDGSIYVGTDCGLARSRDGGDSWFYTRGADWKDKAKGLIHPALPVKTEVLGDVLTEDYVTSLAQDSAGRLWVGHRQTGAEALDPDTLKRVYPTSEDKPSQDYVACLYPARGMSVLVGGYGGGLVRQRAIGSPDDAAEAKPPASSKSAAKEVAFPAPAKPPSAAALRAMLRQVKAFQTEMSSGSASYLGEDWTTQGDWLGRYGRQYARLCAMDHVITCTNAYKTDSQIGPHHDKSDGLRWFLSRAQTDNPRSLYTPVAGVRRQAEWDDHGETYPQLHEGPDIWTRVTLKEGNLHRLSFYFLNKDGHGGDNRCRDYTIEIKPDALTPAQADALPTLAHARVVNFWGGVYKQFVVRSPGAYWVKIGKNNSLNTIISAVLIDKLRGRQTATDQMPSAYMNQVRFDPPDPVQAALVPAQGSTNQASAKPEGKLASAATQLWAALDSAYASPQSLPLQHSYGLLAYRAEAQGGGSDALLGNWRWGLGLWTPEDRTAFTATMAQAWQAQFEKRPHFIFGNVHSITLSLR